MNDLYIDCFEITMTSGDKYYSPIDTTRKKEEQTIRYFFSSIIDRDSFDEIDPFVEIYDTKTKKYIYINTKQIESICEVKFNPVTKEVL